MTFITQALSALALATTLLGSTSAAIATPAAPKPATVNNGSYLFGDSQEPDQIGQTYMVFEVNQNNLVGGFYSPASEFSCFTGQVKDEQLRLAVEDATTQNSYNYSMQLYRAQQVVASADRLLPSTSSFRLQEKYRIQRLNLASQKVLDSCKTELQF